MFSVSDHSSEKCSVHQITPARNVLCTRSLQPCSVPQIIPEKIVLRTRSLQRELFSAPDHSSENCSLHWITAPWANLLLWFLCLVLKQLIKPAPRLTERDLTAIQIILSLGYAGWWRMFFLYAVSGSLVSSRIGSMLYGTGRVPIWIIQFTRSWTCKARPKYSYCIFLKWFRCVSVCWMLIEKQSLQGAGAEFTHMSYVHGFWFAFSDLLYQLLWNSNSNITIFF